MSCHVLSCLVMSCHVLSCLVMSCHVSPWRIELYKDIFRSVVHNLFESCSNKLLKRNFIISLTLLIGLNFLNLQFQTPIVFELTNSETEKIFLLNASTFGKTKVSKSGLYLERIRSPVVRGRLGLVMRSETARLD